MLCRNGNVTKREIGAIKMQPEETYVEIAAASAESFQAAIGPNKALERGIRVTRLPGTPDFSRAPSPKPYAGRPSRDERPDDTFRGEPPKNKFGKGPGGGYAAADNAGQERQDSKPWSKKPGKPGFDGPKSDKPKFDKPKFEGAKYDGKGGAGPKGKFSKKRPG
jgi:ATP-dependent RNA helicase DeaD